MGSYLKTMIAALMLLGAGPSTAFAAGAPGPHEIASIVLILVMTVALTFAGGGYAVLSRNQSKDGTVRRRLKIVLAVIAFIVAGLFVMSSVAIAVLGALASGIYAIVRGGNMLWWGIKASRGRGLEYQGKTTPARLMVSGVLLIIVAAVLVGMAFVFGSASAR